MEILKKVGLWLAMGLCIGAGFTVAMYGISYFALSFYADATMEKMNEKAAEISKESHVTAGETVTYYSNYKEFGPDSGLVISSHRERRTPHSLEVLGVLENRGSDAWQAVQLEVELFDKAGVFVDECSSYMTSTIYPGDSKNFKVSCGRCESHPLPAFDTYNISIADAHYRQTHDKPMK